MGIDAVAVLRIPRLAAPSTRFGTRHLVQHRGDCTLLHTMERFHDTRLDEHVLTVRRILGDVLDAHHDPRGVFVFPDVCEPRGKDYASIIQELDGAGGFAPMVAADHLPLRIANAAPGSYDALTLELRQTLGDDGEIALTLTEVAFMVAKSDPGRSAEYRTAMEQLRATMGDGFVRRLEPHLEQRYQATIDGQRDFMQQVERLTQERFEAPLVSPAELDRFFDSGQASAVVASLGPTFQQHLEEAFSALGVSLDELPTDDVARRLAEAAGLEPTSASKRPGRKKGKKGKKRPTPRKTET
jgi:hypothetical protein